MSEKIVRTVQHRDYKHKHVQLEGLTIAECAKSASRLFSDPGPWVVKDNLCEHTVLCELISEWRCVELRGSSEGE